MTLAIPDLIAWLRAKANTQATAADGDRLRQAAEALELALLSGRLESLSGAGATAPPTSPARRSLDAPPAAAGSGQAEQGGEVRPTAPLTLTGYRPPLPPAPPGWQSERQRDEEAQR